MKVRGVSIVIPVYRSGSGLYALLTELSAQLPLLAEQFEVILVDDASPDDSWQVMQSLDQQYEWVHIVQLMRNYGQHNALLCGLRMAQYDITITMDDDLEHPPDQIPLLLERFQEGFDVVYGAPEQEQHGLMRNLASQITKMLLQSSMGVDSARHISAFRVIRTQLRDAFSNYNNPYVSLDVLLTWGTTRFSYVFVRHDPRRYGTSNYTIAKLIRHAINMFTGFSVMPLRIASVIGFLMTIFGLGVLVYVVGRALLLGVTVPGFAFLASTIAMFSGTQMLLFGIMGEYMARIYYRTLERPAYIVRQQSSPQGSPHPPIS